MAKLLTVTEFRQRAGITGTTEDLAINLLLEDVSARIQSYVGRDLERKARVDELHTPGGFSVFVKNPPIDETQLVEVKEESPFIDGIIFPAPITVLTQLQTFSENEFVVDAERGRIALKFRELNENLPDTFNSLLLDMSDQALTFRQLSPMIRMPLAQIAPSIRWMQLLYGTPIMFAPTKQIMFKNIARV